MCVTGLSANAVASGWDGPEPWWPEPVMAGAWWPEPVVAGAWWPEPGGRSLVAGAKFLSLALGMASLV